MRRHIDDHPWLGEVYEALPEMCVSRAMPRSGVAMLLLRAPWVGLMDCYKCGTCDYAVAYPIRCNHQPQLMVYWDDPPDDAYDIERLGELRRTLRSDGV